MFTRKIELTEGTLQELRSLDEDVKALGSLMEDFIERFDTLLEKVVEEATLSLSEEQMKEIVNAGIDGYKSVMDAENGVNSFEDAEDRSGELREFVGEGIHEIPEGAPAEPWEGATVEPNPDTVERTSPFTRAPRSVQVDWLRQVMASGEWFSAYGISRAYATDERHLRYMKGALGGRLREMHEDHQVERRDSHSKGSMFEYRLVKR